MEMKGGNLEMYFGERVPRTYGWMGVARMWGSDLTAGRGDDEQCSSICDPPSIGEALHIHSLLGSLQ